MVNFTSDGVMGPLVMLCVMQNASFFFGFYTMDVRPGMMQRAARLRPSARKRAGRGVWLRPRWPPQGWRRLRRTVRAARAASALATAAILSTT